MLIMLISFSPVKATAVPVIKPAMNCAAAAVITALQRKHHAVQKKWKAAALKKRKAVALKKRKNTIKVLPLER